MRSTDTEKTMQAINVDASSLFGCACKTPRGAHRNGCARVRKCPSHLRWYKKS